MCKVFLANRCVCILGVYVTFNMTFDIYVEPISVCPYNATPVTSRDHVATNWTTTPKAPIATLPPSGHIILIRVNQCCCAACSKCKVSSPERGSDKCHWIWTESGLTLEVKTSRVSQSCSFRRRVWWTHSSTTLDFGIIEVVYLCRHKLSVSCILSFDN